MALTDAVRKAALEAAAKELYKEACKDAGVKAGAWSKVPAASKKRLMQRAEAALGGEPASPAPAAPTPAQPAQSGQPQPGHPAPVPLAGQARVEQRDEEPEDFDPQVSHVVLDVTRGNLVDPIKIPVEVLAPDVSTIMPTLLENLKNRMLGAQQRGAQDGRQASQPVIPAGSYQIQDADGRVWGPRDKLSFRDFTEQYQDETGTWPLLKVSLIDGPQTQGEARVQPTPGQQAGPVGVGNPVVIGTSATGSVGEVLGVPVAAQQQPQQPPAEAGAGYSQGTARTQPHLTPGTEDQGRARI